MKRLVSLDFFRGITIALMIIVNSPGSWSHVYPPLLHAKWHGMTPTDLVFPFFLFIVGVSIALAYAQKKASGSVSSAAFQKIVKRSFYIFCLGLFLALFPRFDFGNLRVVGVLQRIAIVFMICSILYLKTSWRTQLKVGITCLVGYWICMAFIPFPGGETGSLEPGNNFTAWIDSYITPGRFYQKTWDPEGLFSTIPAIGTGIFGLLVGQVILNKVLSQNKKIIWIFAIGTMGLLIGTIWSWVFPLNKHIWTSSYVLVAGGLASLFLAAAIWFIDELKMTRGTKLGVVFGMNAITAYVLHGVIGRLFHIPIKGEAGIQSLWMSGLGEIGLPMQLASLLWAVSYMLLIYLIVYVMYRKKIFLKI